MLKRWHIKRYIVEHFEQFAETRADALVAAEDPYQIIVTKETAVPVREVLDKISEAKR